MKKGKLIAPVVVTVLLCLWLGTWVGLFWSVPELPFPVKLIGAVVPLALIGVSVFVLAERIKEIRSGEEDDLDNY